MLSHRNLSKNSIKEHYEHNCLLRTLDCKWPHDHGIFDKYAQIKNVIIAYHEEFKVITNVLQILDSKHVLKLFLPMLIPDPLIMTKMAFAFNTMKAQLVFGTFKPRILQSSLVWMEELLVTHSWQSHDSPYTFMAVMTPQHFLPSWNRCKGLSYELCHSNERCYQVRMTIWHHTFCC